MEGRSEEEEKKTGHDLIYTKGLKHRVIISTGAFEGLRHQSHRVIIPPGTVGLQRAGFEKFLRHRLVNKNRCLRLLKYLYFNAFATKPTEITV